MKGFIKAVLSFIFAIIAIVCALGIYDYIKVLYWSGFFDDVFNDTSNTSVVLEV